MVEFEVFPNTEYHELNTGMLKTNCIIFPPCFVVCFSPKNTLLPSI